jgi:hypothetical protein
MKLITGETNLVIAGAWNPAIITPHWVLRHGLGVEPQIGLQIQAFLPAVQGLGFEFPRYALDRLSYSVRPDSFILTPAVADEGLAIIEDAAARMVEQLRHTPIQGIGHNFEFREPEPPAGNLGAFTASTQDLADEMAEDWAPSSTTLVAAFSNDARNVVINVQRHFEAGRLTVKLNFHHPVTTTDQAVALLRGEGNNVRMTENLEFAKGLMTRLYGELENE